MLHYAVHLNAVNDRISAIRLIARYCEISLAEAKQRISEVPTIVFVGPKWMAEELNAALVSSGNVASFESHFTREDVAGWAESISDDLMHCRKCGARLFFSIPKLTTHEEIIEFAAASRLRNKDTILADGWIHPGVYCPNACAFVMVDVFEIDD